MGQKTIDWERIELDYRAGIKTLREIASENGVSHPAISKRARRDGWVRDLSARIQSRADDLVTRDTVSSSVTTESRAAERLVVEANAQAVAQVRLAHRRDIARARTLVNALLSELEAQTDPEMLALLGDLGQLLRAPDDRGVDRLNDLYQAIISLPERSKTMKVLTESLGRLVDMERQAFGMDSKAQEQADAQQGARIAVEFVSPPARSGDAG